jgi:DNA-binding response OmpR family regulator
MTDETAKRLLIVDDEPDFGDFVRVVGEGLGYDTRVAQNVKQFQSLYDEFDPTVIIMDVVMPEEDGIQLIQWLGERGCGAKIIITTGFSPLYAELTDTMGTGHGLYVHSKLTKPVHLADLRRVLS